MNVAWPRMIMNLKIWKIFINAKQSFCKQKKEDYLCRKH